MMSIISGFSFYEGYVTKLSYLFLQKKYNILLHFYYSKLNNNLIIKNLKIEVNMQYCFFRENKIYLKYKNQHLPLQSRG